MHFFFFFGPFFLALSNEENSTDSLVIVRPSCSFSEATEVPTASFQVEKELVFKEQYNNDIRTEPERTEINYRGRKQRQHND